MAVQKQDDQHEHTFSSYVRIRDIVLKTYLGRWTIGRSGERGSGISLLPARYDDDDDDDDYEVTDLHVSQYITWTLLVLWGIILFFNDTENYQEFIQIISGGSCWRLSNSNLFTTIKFSSVSLMFRLIPREGFWSSFINLPNVLQSSSQLFEVRT